MVYANDDEVRRVVGDLLREGDEATLAKWREEYNRDEAELLANYCEELLVENARLRAVVEKVAKQTNQLMDGTDFYLIPGQVVSDAKAALEATDGE